MTEQERNEAVQQEHEELLNDKEAAGARKDRVNWSEPSRDPQSGALVFPAGEVLENRKDSLVIQLPKGRKPRPLEYKFDARTGKASVPKSRVYTYFAYDVGGARLAVSLTVPIPQELREKFHAQGIAKGLRMEPLTERTGRQRIAIDEQWAPAKETDPKF